MSKFKGRAARTNNLLFCGNFVENWNGNFDGIYFIKRRQKIGQKLKPQQSIEEIPNFTLRKKNFRLFILKHLEKTKMRTFSEMKNFPEKQSHSAENPKGDLWPSKGLFASILTKNIRIIYEYK